MIDALYRLVYRTGFPLAQLWWWMTRPRRAGVAIAVRCGERLLVVRQSYVKGLTLPGGGVDAGESARDAALRELREETGLSCPPGELRLILEADIELDHRSIHETLFEWRLDREPALRIDRREIMEALFVPIEGLDDPEGLNLNLQLYLRHLGQVTLEDAAR